MFGSDIAAYVRLLKESLVDIPSGPGLKMNRVANAQVIAIPVRPINMWPHKNGSIVDHEVDLVTYLERRSLKPSAGPPSPNHTKREYLAT